ncbi:MAG: LysE family translocator [Paracoccaceae bacterium]
MTIAGIPVETVAAFALASALIELTPGPNMTWLAVVAVSEGRREGYAAVAGVCLGLLAIGLAAAFGLAAVVAESPGLWQALRWAGIAFLVWLAVDAWRAADGAGEQHDASGGLGRCFRRGLVTNLLNPKAALFYLSVLPAFTIAGPPILPQTLSLTALYVAVATAIHAGIVTLAASARSLLTDPARSRRVRRGLALALLAVAVWFAWATRQGGGD